MRIRGNINAFVTNYSTVANQPTFPKQPSDPWKKGTGIHWSGRPSISLGN